MKIQIYSTRTLNVSTFVSDTPHTVKTGTFIDNTVKTS